MTVITSNTASTAFVQPAGALGAGENFGNLEAAVGRSCLSPALAIVLDMANVTRLDCTGIGELLQLRRRVHAAGREFGLINVERRQRTLLEMARLSTILGIRDAREVQFERRYSDISMPRFGASHRIGLALV